MKIILNKSESDGSRVNLPEIYEAPSKNLLSSSRPFCVLTSPKAIFVNFYRIFP